ncbi:MAG: hypothetical protein WB696_08840 [Chthoniobacterales bacterium]
MVAILRPAIIGDLKKTPFFLRIVPHLSLVGGSTPELTGFAFRIGIGSATNGFSAPVEAK